MSSAMITFNGRVTLPSNVRKELGLKTGDNIDFVEIEKGRFAIMPGAVSIMDAKSWGRKLEFAPAGDEMDEAGL
jgi:AbrB family looped-hinge helix DNA binding protein